MAFRKSVKKLAAEELLDHAVRYLALQACSIGQLRTKLTSRAAHEKDVDTTISRLQEIGYLNDERFAESFANNRVQNDGFGRMRVLQDLRARQVPGRLAEQALEKAFEGKSEAAMIESFIERRMPSVASGLPVADERKLAAAYRRLRRAGFSSGAALTALKKRAAHPDALEDPPDDEAEPDLLN